MKRNGLATRAGLIVGLFLAATVVMWASAHRSAASSLLEGERITVTSSGDSGPGSLREALFAVARAAGRATVLLRTEHIEIDNPLPPIINPHGVLIQSITRTLIDATHLADGPVLDFHSDEVEIANVSVDHAPDVAVLLRGRNTSLRALVVTGSAVGIEILAAGANISIRNCTFSRNGIAIKAPTVIVGVMEGNQFDNSQQSALWVVAGSFEDLGPRHELRISDNSFTADRDAVVLGNIASRLELNRFSEIVNNAVSILGGRTAIDENKFHKVRGTSVLLDASTEVEVSSNDISSGAGIGIMARSVATGSVARNRVYGNSYGLVQVGGNPATPLIWEENMLLGQRTDGVLVIGASPLLRLNRALNNVGAGIRVLSLLDAEGHRTAALPHMEGNVTTGNGINEVARGDYGS